MLKHPLLQPCAEDPEHIRIAKQRVRQELKTIESVQFLLCEWSKIVAFLTSGSPIYLRNYWRQAELQTPDQWGSDESADERIQ